MQKQKKFGLILFILTLSLNFAFAQESFADQLASAYTHNWTKLDGFYLSAEERSAKYMANIVTQDNELERNEVVQAAHIYDNPLMLNGKQLNYGKFSLFSKGILTLVTGNPETNEAKPISFYVSIRREGKVIENKKMLFANKSLQKINLSEIFAFAKDGDLLIIKPVRAEYWKAKRILKLIGTGC